VQQPLGAVLTSRAGALLLAAAYIAAAELGLALAFPGTNVSPVWPPSGIALAALYVGGLRFWPAVGVGAFTINCLYFLNQAAVPLPAAILGAALLAIGNTLEAVAGAYLLRRVSGQANPFDSLRGVLGFILLPVVLACVIAASIGVTSTRFFGVTGGTGFTELWLTWWIGDASGVMTVAPFLIICQYHQWRWPSRQRITEAGLLLLTVCISSVLVFDGGLTIAAQHYPIAYLLVPSVLWAVLRFHALGAAASLLLISMIAVVATVNNSGPFGRPTVNESLLLLQLFIAMLSSTALSLAAVLIERNQLAERLQESNRELQRLAFYDGLTGLANRRLFKDRLEQAVLQAERSGQSSALLFLDLDNFKHINDELGHDAGDRLLQVVAERLTACVRQGDSVSRLGGDEFTVLLRDVEDAKAAAVVARKIIMVLRQPIACNGHQITATTSIGITMTPVDSTDNRTLMKYADLALYRAKARGRNTYHFFTEELNRVALERQQLEEGLRQALLRDELSLQFQPVVRLDDGKPAALAALLRWQHPTGGVLELADFYSIAEDAGFSTDLGHWYLRAACREVTQLRTEHGVSITVAVNLPLRLLCDPVLPDLVESTLKEFGVDSLWLKLEVSETMLMQDATLISAILLRLKQLGVTVSLDHFGSAACPLQQLRRLPVDILILEPTLIADLSIDPDATNLVAAVISLAHQLQFSVIAEGVSTEQQATLLRAHGCDFVQGPFISQPLQAEHLPRLLHAA
jgi:diguanylate cyclase (GGDEF)-like protein